MKLADLEFKMVIKSIFKDLKETVSIIRIKMGLLKIRICLKNTWHGINSTYVLQNKSAVSSQTAVEGCLAGLGVEHITLDLLLVSCSPTLGREMT